VDTTAQYYQIKRIGRRATRQATMRQAFRAIAKKGAESKETSAPFTAPPLIGLIYFHGGCLGCTQQQVQKSYTFCQGCQYFDANWDLPNLNNRPPTKAELLREKIKTNT
jgi:hypothetical protein